MLVGDSTYIGELNSKNIASEKKIEMILWSQLNIIPNRHSKNIASEKKIEIGKFSEIIRSESYYSKNIASEKKIEIIRTLSHLELGL